MSARLCLWRVISCLYRYYYFFLSNEEIGLWYVFVAIAGFAQLLEFGFTSTLARNLLFCLSGVRKLSKQGRDISEIAGEVDWHLARVIIRTSKAIYSVMGVIALIVSASLGTVYVDAVTYHFSVAWSFPSWVVFIVSIFTNLYFLYCLTNLRGVGDIAGENKAKTFGRLAQLLITALLLMAGFGLMAASIGFCRTAQSCVSWPTISSNPIEKYSKD